MQNAQTWPLEVKIDLVGSPSSKGTLNIRPGVNTLVGPNGTGKTRALRAVKQALADAPAFVHTGRKVHFLAAGRTSPMEHFRSAVNYPNHIERETAAVGSIGYQSSWWHLESITGVLLALKNRPDLRLKVEARLQQLFDRSIALTWMQAGLSVEIFPMKGGSSYAANHEASGILQLVALLAAIHNDEIGVLLVDEPEISLHPQHQAFVLEEMERVAGDPTNSTKKIVVIATHSASFLSLRTLRELPSIAFFNSALQSPVQVHSEDEILKRTKLGAMMARLSSTHRMAMFAERVLLVEGPSDEIIATQLARRLELRLLARNAQILPVTGKGEFIEVAKLFSLMNKRVAVLADLDALADSNDLVRYFSELPEAASIADEIGRKSVSDLDGDLRNALAIFMTNHESAVSAAAAKYKDWSSSESRALSLRRVTLARLLIEPTSFDGEAASPATSLCTRYGLLLNALEKLGCFFLRRGAIENYYEVPAGESGKPDSAATEAAGFDARGTDQLNRDFRDVLAPLQHIAPNHRVDEDLLLRPKLGAALTAAFLSMTSESSDEELNTLAKTTIGTDAEVFRLANRSNKERGLCIEVEMVSPLFSRDTFPFDIGHGDNPNVFIRGKLPGVENA